MKETHIKTVREVIEVLVDQYTIVSTLTPENGAEMVKIIEAQSGVKNTVNKLKKLIGEDKWD